MNLESRLLQLAGGVAYWACRADGFTAEERLAHIRRLLEEFDAERGDAGIPVERKVTR